MIQQEVFLLRGLPGSGKTTLANKIINSAAEHRVNMMHNEADHFFESVDIDNRGEPYVEYHFNRKLLGAAHDFCYGATIKAMAEGHSVVVANAFPKVGEIMRYVNGIRRCGFTTATIRVLHLTTQFENVHGVPAMAIERMKARWEPFEGQITVDGEGWK